MFKILKKLFSLLTSSQRQRFYVLQILVILMACVEIAGVISIIPFMTLVGDITLLKQDTIISQIYKFSGVKSETKFIFLMGVGVLITLFVSALISIMTTWRLAIFGNKFGVEIADRLYTYYLKQNWLYHASGSSAQLTKKIAIEAQRVTSGIVVPLMQMNARIALSFLISISIFIYDPLVAIIGLTVFATAYFILFKVVRIRLQINGKSISEVNEQRFRLMNEGFGGIKDVLLLGRDTYFINYFKETGKTLAYSQGTNTALAQVPRYIMELIAFGSMIALVLYLIVSHNGSLSIILPIVSVYALATFKLLPAFQQIYSSIAGIKSNIAAFETIEKDLNDSLEITKKTLIKNEMNLPLEREIILENVTFTYPNIHKPILQQLSMKIPVKSVIGIVGPSGAGKSTLIDILLGLVQPQEGNLKIDGTILNDKNMRSWQNNIGFVVQNIFLSEGSIAENVAFGIQEDKIDIDKVKKALKLAHLTELVESLKDGIFTKVGERGVKLSGGQRQRIGIARALYHEAEVLVFDEATSSLDGITEKLIMEAIHNFSGKKTIIMIAHRLKTVQKCNQIFFIYNGKIVDQGTYQELIETNQHFKNMTLHA